MNYGICGWFETPDGLNYRTFHQKNSLEECREEAKSLKFYQIKHFEFVPEKGYCWNLVEEKSYTE